MYRSLDGRYVFARVIMACAVCLWLGSASHAEGASAALDPHALADSLTRVAAGAYPPEPSVQTILDALGSGLSASRDELSTGEICLPPGPAVARIITEYSGLSSQASFLWHPAGIAGEPVLLLPGLASYDDSTIFRLSTVTDATWFYEPREGVRWSSDTRLNADGRQHVRIYPGLRPHTYLMFWEDGANLGDGDFNDLVVEVDVPPSHTEIAVSPIQTGDHVPGEPITLEIRVASDNCSGAPVTVSKTDGEGTFTPVTGTGELVATHTFVPESEGIYSFAFDATTDDDGSTARGTVDVLVKRSTATPTTKSTTSTNLIASADLLSCPGYIDTILCLPGFVCFPVSSFCPDFPQTIGAIPPAVYSNGMVYLYVDKSGTYEIYTVAGNIECEPETCLTVADVTINQPPTIQGIPDTTITVCNNGQFCWGPITCSDPDDNLKSCLLWDGPGTFIGGYWCYTPTTTGLVQAVFRTKDDCNQVVMKTLKVNFKTSIDPSITFNGTSVDLCAPGDVLVPYTISNPGGLPLTLTLTGPGILEQANSRVRVPFTQSGSVNLTLTATDECGGYASRSITVGATINTRPSVSCQAPAQSFYCSGDAVCVGYSITDPNNSQLNVTISGFGTVLQRQSAAGSLQTVCFTATQTGNFPVRIIVTDACGAADTCDVNVPVSVNRDPVVTVRDTTVFLCGPGEICIPVACSDPDGNLSSCDAIGSAAGEFVEGEYCFFAADDGNYTVQGIAVDACGRQTTANATVHVIFNAAPAISISGDLTVDAEPGDTVCFPYTINDADGNVEDVSILDDYLYYDANEVCIVGVANSVTCARIIAIDECGVADTEFVCVSAGPGPNPRPKPDLPDTVFFTFCDPTEVCVPFTVDETDCPPQVLTAIGNGQLDLGGPSVCLSIPDPGAFTTGVIASDTCGAETSYVVIVAEPNAAPVINPPQSGVLFICGDSSYCWTIAYSDPDDNAYGASASFGQASGLQSGFFTVCAPVDTAGWYHSEVVLVDSCGAADTVTVWVQVTTNLPPTLELPRDTTIWACAGTPLCLQVICDDPDNEIVGCAPLSLGDATWDGEDLCFAPDVAGAYQWIFEAEDACGATTRDTMRVNIELNLPPVFGQPPTKFASLCDLDTIKIPFVVTDPEGGPLTVTSTMGFVQGNEVCIVPQSGGFFCFDIIATDSCGLADTTDACVTIVTNSPPTISAPSSISKRVCTDGEFCFGIDAGDERPGWEVAVAPSGSYDAQNKLVCFTADTAGYYRIIMTITDSCGVSVSDTTICHALLNSPPTLSGVTSQLIAVCEPGEGCLIGVVGTDPDGNLKEVVVDSGNGTLDPQTGRLCFDAQSSGQYCFRVRAEDSCGIVTTRTYCGTVSMNAAPTVTVDDIQGNLYFNSPSQICVDLMGTDPNFNQAFTLSQIDGAGTFTPVSGRNVVHATHCFIADTTGCYRFVFEAADSCGLTARDTSFVCVTIDMPDTLFKICIDTVNSLNDRNATVKIRSHESMEMGGFDFVVCFDPTALTFSTAWPDSAMAGWEYFTYRVGQYAVCPPCTPGALRFIGIADMNNGPIHPPESAYLPRGPMVALSFYVTQDRTFLGQCIPINFCSYDCGDNSISSRGGDTLFVSASGVADSCVTGSKNPVLQKIMFCDGRICIIPPPDDRGDLNLNGIANEIADIVFYSNFFIYGPGILDPVYKDNQILASDVNCDGLTLTISDLVYLIRIVTGDDTPIDCPDILSKPSAAAFAGRVSLETDATRLNVWLDAPLDVGGVFVRLALTTGSVDDLEWGQGLADMKRNARQQGDDLRVLAVSRRSGVRLPAGRNLLFSLPIGSAAGAKLVESQAAGSLAELISVEMVSAAGSVPNTYELQQNYPNPFNAATQIRFSLGDAAKWELIIYNVLGQPVGRFEGRSEAGPVSVNWEAKSLDGKPLPSGVYFARLQTAGFTDTRKMVLLK